MTIGSEFDSVLAAAQAGAEWAFAVLYRDLNPRLLRYLGARAPSAAEDVAAETWLAVARQLASFSGGEAAFRGWLFTIARRRLIQHWRDTGRRPATPVAPESLVGRAGSDDPEADALSAVSARAAAAAIAAALSPDQADVVLLRVLAGLDVDQVAEILGKRPGTVRVLQHKALRRLANRFSPEALTGWAPDAMRGPR
jgi:RNA polymerase sigma-70 factor (ECF subfamily)